MTTFPTITVPGRGYVILLTYEMTALVDQHGGAPALPSFSLYNDYQVNPSEAPIYDNFYPYNPGNVGFPSSFWTDASGDPANPATMVQLIENDGITPLPTTPSDLSGEQPNYVVTFTTYPTAAACAGHTCPDAVCCSDYGTGSCFTLGLTGTLNDYDVATAYCAASAGVTWIETVQSDWPPDSALYPILGSSPAGLVFGTGDYDDAACHFTGNASLPGGPLVSGIVPQWFLIACDLLSTETEFHIVARQNGQGGIGAYNDLAQVKDTCNDFGYNPDLAMTFTLYQGDITDFSLDGNAVLQTTAAEIMSQTFSPFKTTDTLSDPTFSFIISEAPAIEPPGYASEGIPSGPGGSPGSGTPASAIYFIKLGTLNWHRSLTYGEKPWYNGLNRGQGAGYSWIGAFPWFLPPGIAKG